MKWGCTGIEAGVTIQSKNWQRIRKTDGVKTEKGEKETERAAVLWAPPSTFTFSQ